MYSRPKFAITETPATAIQNDSFRPSMRIADQPLPPVLLSKWRTATDVSADSATIHAANLKEIMAPDHTCGRIV
jgi:hypothetical protein